MSKIYFLFGLLASMYVSFAQADEKQNQAALRVMEQAVAFYKNSFPLTIHFIVKSYWSATESRQTQKGVLYMAKNNAFRLETTGLCIVSDGLTMWKHAENHNQVTIQNAAAGLGQMHPSSVLFDFLKCKPLSFKKLGKNRVMLRLLPSGGLKNFDSLSVILAADTKKPIQVFVVDAAENSWNYILNKVKTGVRHKKKTFSFKPPKSAEVIDLR